jgi:hypothetical protein
MLIMILLKYFFWTICVLCVSAAFRFGQREERRGMAIIAMGSMATALVAMIANNNFRDTTFWFLLVDISVLVAFVRLSLDSNKYWPIWVGSLQLISVIIHLLDLLVPTILPAAYIMLQGFWVYPMFVAIMAGTYGSRVAMRRKRMLSAPS